MHIPDAYLGPATQAAALVVMAPIWYFAGKHTSRSLSARKTPLLSIGAAFCFAIQMFNVPAIGGTSAHPLGAALLAILVGPWAAILGVSVSLVIQAFLFGDGGILCLGANAFNMAFVAPVVGITVFRLICGSAEPGSVRYLSAAGLGAYAGTVTASLSAGVLLGLQPLLAHDAAGHALYCPFGLSVSVPAMVLSHLLVAGPAEAIVTVGALAYLWKAFPELVQESRPIRAGQPFKLGRRFAYILALTPIGLLATGTAWGEWDPEELRKLIGFVPKGVAQSHALVQPIMPDYGFASAQGGFAQVAGYLLSACLGCGLVMAVSHTLARGKAAPPSAPSLTDAPRAEMPSWMSSPNQMLPERKKDRGAFLRRTLEATRALLADTIATERIAASRGFLQALDPSAKTISFLILLAATSLTRSPWVLGSLCLTAFLSALASRAPILKFLGRVAAATLFFGAIAALPVCLQAVTPGPKAFLVFGLSVSKPGIMAGAMIVSRLAAAISLALLWRLTTRWNELLGSLRFIGVPSTFLFMTTLAYRYLFVLVETLGEMVQARTARQVGACNRAQVGAYSGSGSAILFAKSIAFTEELHMAMQARGAGRISNPRSVRTWRFRDVAAVAFAICILLFVLPGVLHAL